MKDMRDDEDDLFKLNSGKKTVKAMFSSIPEQKVKLEAKIEQVYIHFFMTDQLTDRSPSPSAQDRAEESREPHPDHHEDHRLH